MIQAGKNVTVREDALQKIKPEYLYHKLINPDADISSRIRQLRIVRQLNPTQYSQLKKTLPYIVCGIFNPPYRRTENFAYTEYFMIDIDKISEKEMSLKALRTQLQTDSRVMLCFISPGEDGLKLMFRLKERCYDAGIYSLFYRLFVKQFTIQYHLQQVIDARTCDVARACFISMDADAYFNPDADAVDLKAYINEDNASDLFRLQKELDRDQAGKEPSKPKEKEGGPDDESMMKIKAMLNPKLKSLAEKREAFVPEELNVLMERLLPFLADAGLIVDEVVNIQFGKKLKLKLNFKEAEINLFYGKKGYSVVQTPRKGTNEELNVLCAELINQFLLQ